MYKPKVRLRAAHGGPLLGNSMYQYGFYDAGLIREILNHIGSGEYKVWALPIPRNEQQFQTFNQLLDDPSVQYALVDKDKIVFLTLENNPGWLSYFNELGYEVFSGPKTNKRLKSAHRPTLINAQFDNLNIKIVDPTEYSDFDFTQTDIEEPNAVPDEYRNPEVAERLLDGGFVISRRLIQEAVKNIPVHYSDDISRQREYYCDPNVRSFLVEHLLSSPIYNARIIGPMGFLKGNAIVVDNLPEGVDVITSRTNIKKEMKYNNGYRLLAEPQASKTRVLSDEQTVVNFPFLFPEEDMKMWLTEEYEKLFQQATSDNLLTNWPTIFQRRWRDKDDPEDNKARAKTIYVGYRWRAAGMQVTHSPWLFYTTAASNAAPIKERVLIPCSVYEQVIPESLARMAGYDIHVDDSSIVRISELGVHVVNDMDWLEMYPSHGGHDEDDFFKLFYREIEGGPYDGYKMVIVARSPNGYGEYSMFHYVEGEWNPAWQKSDGTEVRFPKVDGTQLPRRLSSAIAFGEVSYSGLPSASKPKEPRSGSYTKEDVIRDVRIAMAGGSVGLYVNAAVLHSSVLAQHRPVQLCSLEDVIDKCTNPDDEADVVAIDAEAYNMINEAILSGLPIDPYIWETRGSKSLLKENQTLNLQPGKLSYLNSICFDLRKAYLKRVFEWSQENCRPPQIIHDLGVRFYSWSRPILKAFRKAQYNANHSDPSSGFKNNISREAWESLYQSVFNKITSFERIEDQHDFVLGLYSMTINTPTTYGHVSDQIIFNRLVYPYVEAALQFYGIAKHFVYVRVDNQVRIHRYQNNKFAWPDQHGNLIEYTDPVQYQTAHSQTSPFVFAT